MASDGSGQDPLAVYQDMLGIQGLTGPNPYLEYTGQIPMAGYAGAPTNAATGKPIQSYVDANNAAQAQYQQQLAAFNAKPPGTTLNTSGAATGGGLNFGALAPPSPGGPSTQNQFAYNLGLSGMGPAGDINPSSAQGLAMQAAQQQQQQPAPTPPSPPDMRQAYLQALANPGAPPTYGAQMQPGASLTGAPQPSVLSAFLAAHPSGGSQIPGGYGNTTFFNTLNNLQAAKGAAT